MPVFWPEKGKGKPYLISGFHQAYTYARDYNEPCAYLVIFKMCKEDVNFLVPATQALFPCLTLNNKTIFFVVGDLCDHGAPASKRGPLKSVDISAEELVQSVESEARGRSYGPGPSPPLPDASPPAGPEPLGDGPAGSDLGPEPAPAEDAATNPPTAGPSGR